jgi:hypothetical protein
MTGIPSSPFPMAQQRHSDLAFDPWSDAALAVLNDAGGAVTLYAEMRVALPHHDAFLTAIDTLAAKLRMRPGFISLALKQMSGDSTMVKNYPEAYKGVLATAYLDGITARTQPYFYNLFVRFADAGTTRASGFGALFEAHIHPLLHAVALGGGNGPELLAYRATLVSVAAGDRAGIYHDPAQILDFLHHPVDAPEHGTVTVENHVMVPDAGHAALESKVAALLEVAQNTFEPKDEPSGIGLRGARDNHHYRKALSTEILRNAHADGGLRAYIMHGVWESVWDHENSHIDPRFLAAAGPVGAAAVVGPVEPFYLTRKLVVAG